MKHVYVSRAASLFAAGALLYPSLEILWRGYTHPAMAVAGGTAGVLLYGLNTLYPHAPRAARAVAGAFCILLVEFNIGVICNLFWHMGIWDYSHRFGNLLGQVCPAYALLWVGLSYLFSFVYDRIRAEKAEAAAMT